MNMFTNFAKSQAGKLVLNAVRETVETRVNQLVSSSANTDNKQESNSWPRAFDDVSRPEIIRNLDSQFALGSQGNGYLLVYLPANFIVYQADKEDSIIELRILWEVFSGSLSQLEDPIPMVNKLVKVILRDREMRTQCKPICFAIMAGFKDHIQSEIESLGKQFTSRRVNSNDDTPVHVAVRFGSLETLALVWDDHFDPKWENAAGETIIDVAQRTEIVEYLQKRLGIEGNILDSSRNLMLEEKKCPASFSTLLSYWATENVPHWLFLPPKVLTESNVTAEDVQKVMELLYAKDPLFLGRLYKNQNVFHTFDKFPEKYQKVALQYSNSEMLNKKDSSSMTPLHYVAKNGNLETFIRLYSFGAEFNQTDCNGKYPRDYAIERDSVELVKAFLVLDEEWFKDPIDCREAIANARRKGAKRVKEMLDTHLEYLCTHVDKRIDWNMSNPSHHRSGSISSGSKPFSNTDCLAFSIDGGGMKGLLALQMLKELELVAGKTFWNRVNHIGGTSTGSILTLGLAKYKSVDPVIRAYFRLKDDVFHGSRPYAGENLEKALVKEFGRSDLKSLGKEYNVRISIPVSRVDFSPPMLYMFRSYDVSLTDTEVRPDMPKDWSAAKIVQASCAAPSFFPPVDGRFMDGGLIANNPTLDILTELQRLKFSKEKKLNTGPLSVNPRVIVSIGTGFLQKKIDNVSLTAPTTVTGILNTFNQVLHLKDVFIDQITAADGVTVERAAWMAEAMKMSFFRFSPKLELPMAIDEKDNNALLDAMLAVKYNSDDMLNNMRIFANLVCS